MSKSKTPPKIFLSYAWKNSNIADEIDNTFQGFGITFQRDIRDVKYRDSIKQFMKKIGKSNYVLMIISDEFLKSSNCMYEVLELTSLSDYKKRILPIVLPNAKIYKPKERILYIEHWKKELDDIKNELNKIELENATGLNEDLKIIDNIYSNISEFLKDICDLNNTPYEKLKSENFEPILKTIGHEPYSLDEDLIEIQNMKDPQEKEIRLDEYITKNPRNPYANFYLATLYEKKKEYKKSRYYYEKYINNFKLGLAVAYYNLATIIHQHIGDYNTAKKHYLKSISINPYYDPPHNNLGNLYREHFEDYESAMKHYKKGLEINPFSSKIYNNIAVLYQKQNNYENAKSNYLKAIEINPKFDTAFYNLALLQENHFKDYEIAKVNYNKAIIIDPNNYRAYNNLGLLFEKYFNDFQTAEINYKKSLEINENYDPAWYNLARIYMGIHKNKDLAQKYYETACKLNSKNKTQNADKFFAI